MSDPSHASLHPQDEKTEVLPETAVQLVELERLKIELAAADERAKNHWEQYLRALADVDNVRKRAAKDLENTRQFAVEKFAQELVGVKDSLELALANAPKADVASLLEGQQATLRLLSKAFEKAQIEEIN
jgi:molecular chaperone GrpE